MQAFPIKTVQECEGMTFLPKHDICQFAKESGMVVNTNLSRKDFIEKVYAHPNLPKVRAGRCCKSTGSGSLQNTIVPVI